MRPILRWILTKLETVRHQLQQQILTITAFSSHCAPQHQNCKSSPTQTSHWFKTKWMGLSVHMYKPDQVLSAITQYHPSQKSCVQLISTTSHYTSVAPHTAFAFSFFSPLFAMVTSWLEQGVGVRNLNFCASSFPERFPSQPSTVHRKDSQLINSQYSTNGRKNQLSYFPTLYPKSQIFV